MYDYYGVYKVCDIDVNSKVCISTHIHTHTPTHQHIHHST